MALQWRGSSGASGCITHAAIARQLDTLFNKFGLSLASAGLFFFWSGVLAALSFAVAAWLARRIGLVNTMAFTQLPSTIALVFAAVAPSLELAMALLLARGLPRWMCRHAPPM